MLILKGLLFAVVLFLIFGFVYVYGINRVPFRQGVMLPVGMLKTFGTFVTACGTGLLVSGVLTIVLWRVASNFLQSKMPR